VSVWVPIGVAGVGFIGVLASQWIGSWREDRRWRRERELHDDDRRYAARQEAYAQLIGTIERWDLALYPLRTASPVGVTDVDPVQLERVRESADSATRAMGLVTLVAPEQTRVRIRDVVVGRFRLMDKITQGGHDGVDRDWRACQDNYRTLRALMRTDLGFDAEAEYLQRIVGPVPSPAIGSAGSQEAPGSDVPRS
jgi:hypothetical protein